MTEQGREYNVCEKEFKLSSRGAIGRVLLKRGTLAEWLDRQIWVQAGEQSAAAAVPTNGAGHADDSEEEEA